MAEAHASEVPTAGLEGVDGGRVETPRRGWRRRAPGTDTEPITHTIREAKAPEAVLGREGHYRRGLAVADILAAALALTAVLGLTSPAELQPGILLLTPLLVVVNKLAGLYDRDDLVLNKTTLDEAPAVLQISGLFCLLVWLIHPLLLPSEVAPGQVIALWATATVLTILFRAGARRLAARVDPPEHCLLVGAPATMAAIEAKLRSRRVAANVVARVPLDERRGIAQVAEDLPRLVREAAAHRVVVAPLTSDGADTLEFIRAAKALGMRVSVLPRLLEVVGSSVTVDEIDGMTMLGIRSFGFTRSSGAVKRAFDVIGSGLLLLIGAPLMGAIALAIRLDTGGPVFFRQTRVGRNGRRFEIVKFRSMVNDAEQRKAELEHLNETEGLFKIADDPRITSVGRFLRTTSLDELPQLINVWRGEMSLVGPRPLVVDEDAKVAGHHRARLQIKPGMTGHWQILGAPRVPLGEMVGIDYLYVANWSVWTDVKILLRTIPYVLRRAGL